MATVEMAKQLINKDGSLSITVLIIKSLFENEPEKHNFHNDSRIHFILLPKDESISMMPITNPLAFHRQYIESYKDHVRSRVAEIVASSNTTLAGFVVDMFCTCMIDVANEFKVPTYMFFTSGASTLGLMLHVQSLKDDHNIDITEYLESRAEISVKSYKNPVPVKLLPAMIGSDTFLTHVRGFRETKGIIVNTFLELEPMAINFLSDEKAVPPVYPIGPILHLDNTDNQNPKYVEIINWLDEQPKSSVVFLCFGSKGCFDENQVQEIAIALERTGHRFLWSLRKPPTKHAFDSPSEYESPEEILPEGFFQRTSGIGKVIGWAPQVAVLSHPAVGGFVSHCGWNSVMESVWYGVPIAAWPIQAEQHVNAFQLVKDLGVAVEIKMDYKKSLIDGSSVIVTAEEIENGIRGLMEPESDIQSKIKAMKMKSRMALEEGGSSIDFMGRFIDNVIDSIPPKILTSDVGSQSINCFILLCPELVFIPSPGRGHLMATVEMAKQLINKDERLSITVLIIKSLSENEPETNSFHNDSRIQFILLPKDESISVMSITNFLAFHNQYIESYMHHVRSTVAKIVASSNRTLAGFVVDMFCTCMIDVANEFKVPTYVFFTSGASTLGLMFHVQSLKDDHNMDIMEYEKSGEISVKSYKYPVPVKLLPATMLDKNGGNDMFLKHVRRIRETKGIMINTFLELEPIAINFLSDEKTVPPVYPIGPILHLDNTDNQNPKYVEIINWLDEQPKSSVVFLCFGSKGCFDENQVKEIAIALERTGHRFLWSLRRPPTKHKFESPSEYEHPEEILPEGFFQRTSGIGKVIAWAPQVAVLSHPAVGGFVSHCGWNSTLESISCGVPMATWPIQAEQQLNAFQLVKDLGVAVEIKMDYRKSLIDGSSEIVTAEEIENGIRGLMDPESDAWSKIKEMKMKSRMALGEDGSSISFMGTFIDNVIDSIPSKIL